MLPLKSVFAILILIACVQCGRYGGGRSGGGSRGSSSRGSYHPSYSSSSGSRSRPSPPPRYAPARPSAPPRYTPARPSPAPRYPPARPSPPPTRSSHINSQTQRPVYQTPSRVGTQRPVQATPARGFHQPVGPTARPGGFHTTRRPMHVGTTPRRLMPHSTARATGFGHLPPRPGSAPIGPPRYNSPSYSGPQKVKIVNKYNYHYPGYYSMPMAQYHYPGYYYTPSYYRYGIGDTGSTALGFYLGYSLSRLTTPTYSHYSFYDGYRPRYDHYEVHHYYHNRDAIPQRQEIQANTIIGCVGDSANICPANTTSLCTSNGALMCVASALSTVPCTDNRQLNCVTSTISCVNNTAPECKNSNQKSTTISIPCVSKAEIQGELKTVNNTIIPANATLLPVASQNGTEAANSTEPILTTTTPLPTVIYKNYTETTTVPNLSRRKRSTPQDFCVTILALPAKRQPTAGEEFLKDAKYLTEKFLESVWNV